MAEVIPLAAYRQALGQPSFEEEDFFNAIGQGLELYEEEPPVAEIVGGHEIAPLDDEDLKSIVAAELDQSIGQPGSEVSRQRILAMRYYYGELFGNEQEGRSKAMLTDVHDTVEWIMPSTMRMFWGPQVVRFQPNRPHQGQMAKEATAAVNHIFRKKLDGFRLLYDAFKTALVEKNAFFKTYYEELYEPKVETYRGLEGAQVEMLLDDGSVKVTGWDTYTKQIGPMQIQLYDLEVEHRTWRGQIKVDGIPPEQMRISRRDTCLDDSTTFAAQCKPYLASDIIAMGFPREVVENLPSGDSARWNEEAQDRAKDEESVPFDSSYRRDAASREIWLTECSMRVDYDGDGYSELRKVLVAGDASLEILENERQNFNPFVSITPIPLPFKFFGMSVADQVMDLQLIRSTVLRQMLDNMYLTNNSMYEVAEGLVEIDDLLTSRPGGIVRVQEMGSIKPLEHGALPDFAFKTLEYLESQREGRSGVSKWTQGLDAEALNSQTAYGIGKLMSAAHAKVELIARVFAEQLKRLFKNILRLMIESPMKEFEFEVNGEWMRVDPSSWDEDLEIEIELGLGVGQSDERVRHLGMVLDLQKQLKEAGLGGYMVTPENLYNAIDCLMQAMNFQVEGQFFTRPQGPPPDPGPSPEEQKIQAEMAMAKQKDDTDRLKLVSSKAQDDRKDEFCRRELESKERIEMAKIASDERIALMRLRAEMARAQGGAS